MSVRQKLLHSILFLTAAFVSLRPTFAAAEDLLTLDEIRETDLTVTFQSDCDEKSEPNNFHQMQSVPTREKKFILYFDPGTIQWDKYATFFEYTFYVADTGSRPPTWYECRTQVHPHGAFRDRNVSVYFTINRNHIVDNNSLEQPLDLPIHSIGEVDFLEITTPDPTTGKPAPTKVNLSKLPGVELSIKNLLKDMPVLIDPIPKVTSSNPDYWEPFDKVKLSDSTVRIPPGQTVGVWLPLTPKRLPALLSTLTSVKPDGLHDRLTVTLNYASDGGANRLSSYPVGIRFVPSNLDLIFALLLGSLLGTMAAQILPGAWKGWRTAAQKAARGLLFALIAEVFAILLVGLGSRFVIVQFDLDPWQFLPVFFIGFVVSGGKDVLSYLGLSRPGEGSVAPAAARPAGAP
jgi:hypothetical protein